MENQQPIKQKDLQYFKDEVAEEYGHENFSSYARQVFGANYPDKEKNAATANAQILTDTAAERYAAYKEQQAKHAGFIEGANSRWISVDDQLPELGDRVLVSEKFISSKDADPISEVTICSYVIDKTWLGSTKPGFLDEQDEQPGACNPTHWMPVPYYTYEHREKGGECDA